ncbi:hypothetical protein FOA52_015173 [Chlamydomonas sp. UWO 241]|nr:hypothetical protein FOA52_015173 [Chlamydomonas sp. UWO 241]
MEFTAMLPLWKVGSRRPGRSSQSGVAQQHTQQAVYPGSIAPALHACLSIGTSREPRRSEPGNNTASRPATVQAIRYGRCALDSTETSDACTPRQPEPSESAPLFTPAQPFSPQPLLVSQQPTDDASSSMPRLDLGKGISMTPSELLITQIRGCTTEVELLSLVVEQHLSGIFSAVHAATALHQAAHLATSTSMEPKVVKQLSALARPYVPKMQPRHLANTALALAKFGDLGDLMDEVTKAVKPQLRSFDMQEAAMMRRAKLTLA